MSARPDLADVRLENQVREAAEDLRKLRAELFAMSQEISDLTQRVYLLENP